MQQNLRILQQCYIAKLPSNIPSLTIAFMLWLEACNLWAHTHSLTHNHTLFCQVEQTKQPQALSRIQEKKARICLQSVSPHWWQQSLTASVGMPPLVGISEGLFIMRTDQRGRKTLFTPCVWHWGWDILLIDCPYPHTKYISAMTQYWS